MFLKNIIMLFENYNHVFMVLYYNDLQYCVN